MVVCRGLHVVFVTLWVMLWSLCCGAIVLSWCGVVSAVSGGARVVFLLS
jgi:hypothetical protein